ncbi:MAG: DUF5103 domain-containing protein [Bacteroidetes bacterium]|nr:DUF5103 domain-containing protein [Bacteroidota bacterium]
MRNFVLCFIITISNFVFSQDEKTVYTNQTFDPLIESVLLTSVSETADPVPLISLVETTKLQLSFDLLKTNNEFYQYTFIHCDANWKESNMNKNEFLSGNFNNSISDFSFSTNTYQKYVSYRCVFPNNDVKFTRSGNYVIKVYRDFNEDDVVLIRRFMVIDPKVTVTATVNSATDVKFRFSKQEVDFNVDFKNFNIPNPFSDVKVSILQNNNWTNAITDLKPNFVNNAQLVYNYETGNLFPGGNEFRQFDIRSLRFFSYGVADKFIDSMTNAVLKTDELKAHLQYFSQADFNGKRAIQNKDGSKNLTDGDYAIVHFTLKSNNEISPDGVYIFGELTDWQIKEKFKMDYYPEKRIYYKSVKLKQSYYNYEYVTLSDDKITPETTFTEGNHFETENDYDIYVYHKNQQFGYDELIGYLHFNSNTNRR